MQRLPSKLLRVSSTSGSGQKLRSNTTISTADDLTNMTDSFFQERWATKSIDINEQKLKKAHVNFVKNYKDWDLDEQVEEFRNEHPETYESIVLKFNRWFSRHKGQVLYNFINTFGIEDIDYTSFKQCLRDIEIPATDFELHLICLLIDTKNRKRVGLKNLEVNVVARMHKRKDKEERKLGGSLLEFPERYVTLHLMCEMLSHINRFKGHVTVMVKSDLHVISLIDVLNNELPLNTRNILFYFEATDATREESPLPMHVTLASLGIPDGPRSHPPSIAIFYNYVPRQLNPLIQYVPYSAMNRRISTGRLNMIQQEINRELLSQSTSKSKKSDFNFRSST